MASELGDLSRGFVHLQKLPGGSPNYFCRVWEPGRILNIEPDTGQPWEKYNGTCVICVEGRKAEVIGILKIPMGIFWIWRRKLREELEIDRIGGEMWNAELKKKTRVEFNLWRNESKPPFEKRLDLVCA